MGVFSRLKDGITIPTFSSASVMFVPDDVDVFYISGTTAVGTLQSSRPYPGRRVTMIGAASTRDIQSASGSTTPYTMDLGSASEIALGENDVIRLVQKENGVWVRVFSTDN